MGGSLLGQGLRRAAAGGYGGGDAGHSDYEKIAIGRLIREQNYEKLILLREQTKEQLLQINNLEAKLQKKIQKSARADRFVETELKEYLKFINQKKALVFDKTNEFPATLEDILKAIELIKKQQRLVLILFRFLREDINLNENEIRKAITGYTALFIKKIPSLFKLEQSFFDTLEELKEFCTSEKLRIEAQIQNLRPKNIPRFVPYKDTAFKILDSFYMYASENQSVVKLSLLRGEISNENNSFIIHRELLVRRKRIFKEIRMILVKLRKLLLIQREKFTVHKRPWIKEYKQLSGQEREVWMKTVWPKKLAEIGFGKAKHAFLEEVQVLFKLEKEMGSIKVKS